MLSYCPETLYIRHQSNAKNDLYMISIDIDNELLIKTRKQEKTTYTYIRMCLYCISSMPLRKNAVRRSIM